jgi:hypothetical protein
MPFTTVRGLKGKVYVPDPPKEGTRKHSCKDCYSCQLCSDDRCSVCLMIAAAYALAKNPATVKNIRKINWTMSKPVLNLRCYVSYHKSAQLKNFPIR